MCSALLTLLVIVIFCASHAASSVENHGVRPIRPLRILVLGGTGFVGSLFIQKAVHRGHEVVAVSRRGRPESWQNVSAPRVEPKWLSADITSQQQLFSTLANEDKFDVYVHAVGVLFDSQSGLSGLNHLISGSGSSPSSNATYDLITRQTAYNAMDLILQHHAKSSGGKPAMIFVSAAEAGWTARCPLGFLERYLAAKRAVERRLFSLQEAMRPVIFRPSLIWSGSPLGLLPALPFILTNYLLERVLRVKDVVDMPVTVYNLVDAMLFAAEEEAEVGFRRAAEVERMARDMRTRRQKSAVVRDLATNNQETCLK